MSRSISCCDVSHPARVFGFPLWGDTVCHGSRASLHIIAEYPSCISLPDTGQFLHLVIWASKWVKATTALLPFNCCSPGGKNWLVCCLCCLFKSGLALASGFFSCNAIQTAWPWPCIACTRLTWPSASPWEMRL